MLLNEGVPPQAVITGIDNIVIQMENLRSAWVGPDSLREVQNSYLQLVENAERHLASWFENDEGVTAGLHGSRQYQMIREMTAATPRPAPLIGDEWDRQIKALRRLQGKVREFLPLQSGRASS